jgi:hypothetical protein
MAIAFLFGLGVAGGPAHAVPLTLLALPIAAMGARYGRRAAIVVGGAALLLPLIPAMAGIEPAPVVLARGSAFLATVLLLTVGTRLTVEAMESAFARARASMARERGETARWPGSAPSAATSPRIRRLARSSRSWTR